MQPPSRKRASKACLACRARKVRCDISQREGSCTNCFLDKQVCVVKPRPTRYRASKARNGAQSNPSPPANLPTTLPPTASQTSTHLPASESFEQDPICRGISAREILPDLNSSVGLDTASNCENASDQSVGGRMNMDSPGQAKTGDGRHTMASPLGATYDPAFVHADTAAQIDSESRATVNTHVMFSYYPFLELDGLSQMSTEDINFLELQGCFRIPTQPVLDEFIREYFLHVHPSLPVIDEGNFWDMYTHRDLHRAECSHMSLFVFQAMLFASCSFVSQAAIRRLGFTSTRCARAAYFRRAKLLFDFNGERDSVSTAQGALLLTYNSSMRNHKTLNTFWLGIAIQFAKDAGAHRYHTNKSLKMERKNVLKRLWWCCILRDRILPLGVRRPLHISSMDFDFNMEPLTKADFENEIFTSKVYDATTKLSLIQLLLTLCDLAVALTEVIMMVYPLNESIVSGLSTEQKTDLSLNRIESCKRQLNLWYEKATIKFPTPAGISDSHESLILYTNLMYIYYHSAILAILHHEVLVIVTSSTLLRSHFNQMCRNKPRVEEAAAGITENLKELIQLKLVKHLPISVVAYAALPLVLHVLDVKLSATESQTARKKRRLDIYTEAMKGLQSQYDGTDEICEIIRRMVDYMSVENPTRGRRFNSSQDKTVFQHDISSPKPSPLEPSMPPKVVNDWGDVLLRQPTLYLRIALTIDLSLSKGYFPDDTDFPTALQSRNQIETRFPLYRITIGYIGNLLETNVGPDAIDHNNQYPTIEPDCTDRSRHNDDNDTPMSSSAISTTDPFTGPVKVPSMQTVGQSPGDLELSMCFGSVEMGMQDNVDTVFDNSTAWADAMFLGDEWLISHGTDRT